jgi:hypothetical protein
MPKELSRSEIRKEADAHIALGMLLRKPRSDEDKKAVEGLLNSGRPIWDKKNRPTGEREPPVSGAKTAAGAEKGRTGLRQAATAAPQPFGDTRNHQDAL